MSNPAQLSTPQAVDPDAEAMTAFARGDEAAFVMLYDKHKVRIFNLARRLLNDSARAEEAAQDVFLKLYAAKAKYAPSARFSTFLYRIAINHCLNLKARKAEVVDSAIEAGTNATADDELDNKRLRAALQSALAKLPANQRAALVMCHYEGASYKETADVLDTSESAIKSLVHRARERLTQELAAWMPNRSTV